MYDVLYLSVIYLTSLSPKTRNSDSSSGLVTSDSHPLVGEIMKGFCLSLLLLQELFSNTLGSAANDLERPHTVSDGTGVVSKITLTPFDDKFKFLAQVKIVHLVVPRARTLMRTWRTHVDTCITQSSITSYSHACRYMPRTPQFV